MNTYYQENQLLQKKQQLHLRNETGRFTFEVDTQRRINWKLKDAIEKMYGVKITDVRTIKSMVAVNPLLNILTKVSLKLLHAKSLEKSDCDCSYRRND